MGVAVRKDSESWGAESQQLQVLVLALPLTESGSVTSLSCPLDKIGHRPE